MQAVVLAAGRGMRLGHLTRERTKAMLPILGSPIVRRVIDTFPPGSVDEVILVASPADDELRDYFSAFELGPVRLRIAHQDAPRGTADALARAAPFIRGPFLLTACDNLVADRDIARLIARWQQNPIPEAVLSLMQIASDQTAVTGIVTLDDAGWVSSIVEKPAPDRAPSNISSLPLYIFSTQILSHLHGIHESARGERELPDAIQGLINRVGRVAGVWLPHRLTLTNPEDLVAMNRYYLNREMSQQVGKTTTIGPGSRLLPPFYLEEGVTVGRGSTIGPTVFIESGCQIGDRVQLVDAVLLRGSVLPDGAVVRSQVVSKFD